MLAVAVFLHAIYFVLSVLCMFHDFCIVGEAYKIKKIKTLSILYNYKRKPIISGIKIHLFF